MTTEVIYRKRTGERIELIISPKGRCYCPVCGSEAGNHDWRPYDDQGEGQYDICECGFQFGYTDAGRDSYKKYWSEYKKYWLSKDDERGLKWLGKEEFKKYIKARRIQKIEQLKNIGVMVE